MVWGEMCRGGWRRGMKGIDRGILGRGGGRGVGGDGVGSVAPIAVLSLR